MTKEDLLMAHFHGKLSGNEEEEFQALVEGDPYFAAEVAALTSSRTVFAEDAAANQADGWKKLSSAIDAETFKPANQNNPMRLSWLQTACVAAFAVACWHFAAVPLLTPEDAPVTMASPPADGPTLQVVFADAAPLSKVNEILYALDGSVVSGPSAIGIYRVEFADEAGKKAALETLGQRPDIVSEILSE